ncbi:S16 family serine protease [Nitrospira sp. BLG_1]|uniref:S16 family serine protease n=1 Tax=Nitrospira sp. BLG_1 TaxID=3395883 RepID=UPI0039BCA8EC
MPGRADLYTDREYPGCRQLGEAKTYSPLEISPTPRQQSVTPVPSVPHASLSYSPPQPSHRKPVPFSDVTLSLPLLSVGQDKVGSITGSWRGLVAQLTVGYKADGRGPEILGDSNLMLGSALSFQTAVAVATEAVGYDPRYLTVRILVPTRLDGSSAGGIFAVGVAAALLGDSIRPDICMSGTIELDEEIQAVGRLVDKMNGCRELRKTTMIVPDALDNSHLSFSGAERSIQVIEVHTLAEAYSAATGQALRQVP